MKKMKRVFAAGLAAIMGVMMFTGCNKSEDLDAEAIKKATGLDPKAVVMTIGEDEITMQEAYFFVKWQQAMYQSFASGTYGEEWYAVDAFGEGVTFQDSIKEQAVAQLEGLYITKQHMADYGVEVTAEDQTAIDEAVKKFMESNTQDALNAMMADEELITRVLTNYCIYNKMYNAMVEGVDTSVSAEEARQKTYSYIYQALTTTDDNGNTVDMSASDQNKYYAVFESIAEDAKANALDFDTIVEKAGYKPASHSFGANDEDGYQDINGIADKMAVNSVSDVIVVDGGLFLIKVDDVNDEEATQTARKTMAEKKLSTAYEEKYKEIAGDTEAKVDEELWSKVTLEQPITAITAE